MAQALELAVAENVQEVWAACASEHGVYDFCHHQYLRQSFVTVYICKNANGEQEVVDCHKHYLQCAGQSEHAKFFTNLLTPGYLEKGPLGPKWSRPKAGKPAATKEKTSYALKVKLGPPSLPLPGESPKTPPASQPVAFEASSQSPRARGPASSSTRLQCAAVTAKRERCSKAATVAGKIQTLSPTLLPCRACAPSCLRDCGEAARVVLRSLRVQSKTLVLCVQVGLAPRACFISRASRRRKRHRIFVVAFLQWRAIGCPQVMRGGGAADSNNAACPSLPIASPCPWHRLCGVYVLCCFHRWANIARSMPIEPPNSIQHQRRRQRRRTSPPCKSINRSKLLQNRP